MDARSWQEVKEVLAEVIALPAERRAAFLQKRCPDSVQRREVEAILRHVDQAPDFFDALTTLSTHQPTAAPEPFVLEPGTRVGPYIILERLGAGGMGEVFLGNDPRLRRKVALKCLFASSGDVRSKILREAQVIAQMNHPHIATVHDVVEHGARTFLVMEYVEGESLASHLRRDRLPEDRVLAIGRQLALALAAAHAKGIIHGDLKPANIQLRTDGSIKVLDFGVAQAVSLVATEPSSTTLATRPAAFGGTPAYMSPEQLLGRRIDHRSDIYSLGIVLYEMLTGSRMHPSNDPVERLVTMVKGPAPRADAEGARLSRPLADVVARALEIDVGRRYQAAAEVDAALEAVQKSLESTPTSRREQILKWLPRVAAAVPLTVLLLAVLGAVKTFAFNNNFGRTGPFARFGVEPWPSYFRWGMMGIAPKLLIMTLTTAIVVTARFVLRTLELVPPIDRLAHGIRAGGRRLVHAVGLDKSAMLAQVLTGLGIAMIIGLGWYHADLINAFNASFNSAPIDTLLPMRESARERGVYQAELSIVTLALAFGLYKVIQLRRREKAPDGRFAIATLAGVLAVSIVMNEAPYRSFNYRDFERVDFGGARCYIIGESGDELLVLCPGSDPPRNRTVRRDDPRLQRRGDIENIFRGVNPDPAHP